MKNTAKKTIFLFMLLLAMVSVLAACGGGKQTNVTVKITSPDSTIVDTKVTVTDNEPTASKAIIAACKANNIAYTVKEGLFDGFGGMESSKDEGWLFYYNGTLAQTGAETTSVQEGDVVEFRYENYKKAFSEPATDFFGKWRSGLTTDGSAAFLTLEDDEASFTFIGGDGATISYNGTYNIMNDEITINDLASNSPVKLPFELKDGKMLLTYNAKSIELVKQEG